MATQYTGLPGHIRKFCEGELFAYRRALAEYGEILAEHNAVLDEGGNLGSLDPIGRVDGGPINSSPTEKYSAKRDKILGSDRAMSVARRIARVDGVLDTLEKDEKSIFMSYYWHKMSPDEVAQAEGITETELFEFRAYLATALARAWGMV